VEDSRQAHLSTAAASFFLVQIFKVVIHFVHNHVTQISLDLHENVKTID
jgi:hypothetical protein